MISGSILHGNIITVSGGALVDADSLPVAKIVLDGVEGDSLTVVKTASRTGEYTYSGTVSGAVGVDVAVRASGLIGGESFVGFDYFGQIEAVAETKAEADSRQAALIAEHEETQAAIGALDVGTSNNSFYAGGIDAEIEVIEVNGEIDSGGIDAEVDS